MKKENLIIAIICVCLFASGCETKNATIEKTDMVVEDEQIKLYVLDSCEYIGSICGKWSFLAHKGNCKFCKKRK